MKILVRGVAFNVVPATSGRKDFWTRVASGQWEPASYSVFDRYVSPQTVSFDVGAWIGPTALYLATRCSRVVALEPDPVAFGELSRNLEANPGIKNLEIIQACLGLAKGRLRLNVCARPGDSMSSLLPCASGQAWDVEALGISDLLDMLERHAPLFFKIDIEGFEYQLLPPLLKALDGRQFTILLATHPEIAIGMREAAGGFRKAVRKVRMALINLRLAAGLSSYDVFDSAGSRISPLLSALNVGRARSFTSDRAIVIGSKSRKAAT